MKKNKKSSKEKIFFSVVSVLMVLVFIGFMTLKADNPQLPTISSVQEDGIMTSGGYPSGNDHIRESFEIHQAQVGEVFNDLHFKVWQKEGWIKINGWIVSVTEFTEASSERSDSPYVNPPDDFEGMHAVDCDFWGADIPYCTWLTINIDLWLSDYNTMRISDFYWTRDGVRMVDLPDHAWAMNLPNIAQTQAANVIAAQPAIPGSMITQKIMSTSKTELVTAYLHEVTFSNDDDKAELLFKGLKVMVSADDVENLGDIDFSKAMLYSDFVIEPKQSKVIEVYTDKPYYDYHIYMNYDIYDTANLSEAVYRDTRVDHPVFQPPSS